MRKKVKPNKIVVIGSSNVDFIMKLPRLPRVGESVTNGQFMQTYGGKGANQAVAVARAGGDAWLVNCVGDDHFGPLVLQNLQDSGVHTDFVTEKKGFASGAAVVLIGEEGKNFPTIDPGANYALTPEMLLPLKDFLRDAAMLVIQYEILSETFYTAISMAKELHIPIVFNFAPPREIDRSVINGIDYLIVNETEAEFLFGDPVIDIQSVKTTGKKMLDLGAKTALITLGEQGVYIVTPEWDSLIPAFQVDAVDTTGAGDTFCGTLAVAISEGELLAEAVRFANAAAALCVTKLGAQPSIPTRDQIDDLLISQTAKPSLSE